VYICSLLKKKDCEKHVIFARMSSVWNGMSGVLLGVFKEQA